jgi:hypothetical protein
MNTRQQLEQQRRFPQERRQMHPPIPQATRQPIQQQQQQPYQQQIPIQAPVQLPQPIQAPQPRSQAVRLAPIEPSEEQEATTPKSKSGGGAPKKQKEEVAEPIGAAQAGLSDDQRSAIQRYIQLDDEINNLNATIKEKRAERSELEDELIGILKPLPAPIKTGRTILRTKKKITKEGITQKFWTTKLATSGHLKDPSKAEQLVKDIYKNRSATEDYELVRESAGPESQQ